MVQNPRRTGSQATTRTRYKLSDLVGEMRAGVPLVDGWDEMPAVGAELDPSAEKAGRTPPEPYDKGKVQAVSSDSEATEKRGGGGESGC